MPEQVVTHDGQTRTCCSSSTPPGGRLTAWLGPGEAPALDELLARAHGDAADAGALPRLTQREVALIDGPSGWGEFSPFLEYEPAEAAHWLASAIESAYGTSPLTHRDRFRSTRRCPPCRPVIRLPTLARFPAREPPRSRSPNPADAGRRRRPGQRGADGRRDGAGGRQRRLDRRRGGGRRERPDRRRTAPSTSNNPARRSTNLPELRRRIDIPVAADESIRKAEDPLRWCAPAADVAVLKVAPLAAFQRCWRSQGRSTSRWWSPVRWTPRSASVLG